jgi:hydrogenase expression/formation protein HypC
MPEWQRLSEACKRKAGRIHMCIAIPGKVTKIEAGVALVSFGGSVRQASLDLQEDVEEGDYVIVHAGFVIRRLDEKEALETLELIEGMNLEVY